MATCSANVRGRFADVGEEDDEADDDEDEDEDEDDDGVPVPCRLATGAILFVWYRGMRSRYAYRTRVVEKEGLGF